MNRFITLILILSTLLTFTQKVTASAFVLQSNTVMTADCPMQHMSDSVSSSSPELMDHTGDCAADLMVHTIDCQSDCDFITVPSVVHFIKHDHRLTQPYRLLPYQSARSASPYYFPESLYRPPFPG